MGKGVLQAGLHASVGVIIGVTHFISATSRHCYSYAYNKIATVWK